MKTCPVCQLALEDSYLFCPDDGSSLGTPAPPDAEDFTNRGGSTDRESEPDSASPVASPVVLYCPTCAAEYPLTFSACPVHAAPLVKHAIPRFVDTMPHKNLRGEATVRLTRLHLERPKIERRQEMIVAVTDESASAANLPVTESSETVIGSDYPEAQRVDPGPHDDRIDSFPSFDRDASSERPGLRVAAIATVVALSFLGLLALIMFVSTLSRRRATPAVRVASQPEAALQAVPFVATPQEARDYKEEPEVVPPQPPSTPNDQREPAPEKKTIQRDSMLHKPAIPPPTPTPSSARPTSTPARMTNVSNPTSPPELPRGNAGEFDARLVRVRSNRTSSGIRYDLTFNMLEQAGRPAHWQRLLITTRSASGLSHSQAIPFIHRLGATGALTFTISVEMAGRSEADWQGRVVCTTLGWDNNDRPLQASFGANVTP